MMAFQNLKKELLPLLQEAEKLRKTYRFFKLTSFFVIQSLLLGFIAYMFFVLLFNEVLIKWIGGLSQNQSFGFPIQIFLIPLFLLYSVLYTKSGRKFKEAERKIVRTLIDKILPEFTFHEKGQIDFKEISNSEIISTYRPFQYVTGDKQATAGQNLNYGLLVGKVGDIPISIGNVKIVNQKTIPYYLMSLPLINLIYITFKYVKPWFSKETVEHVGSNFSGMLAIVDFNKKINGTTIVLPDQFEKRIGYLAKTIQSLNFSRDQLVNLEDSEFEKEFVVYSTDQVEARYILSTSLMRRITLLKQKIKKPIILSFKGDKLYMAVHDPYGFFNLRENKNLVDSNVLELFYDDITTAIGIIEDLNLNTQVWR